LSRAPKPLTGFAPAVILASASPRRKELLSRLLTAYTVVVPAVDEDFPAGLSPAAVGYLLALRKAEAVATDYADAVVIAADTLVWLGGKVLEKPKDEADAARMLRSLAGAKHRVVTGVAVLFKGRCAAGAATASVRISAMTPRQIRDYIADCRPLDKAGAYGVQDIAPYAKVRVRGDLTTVVGLPLALTRRLIEKVTKK
jgi:septum formation protein